MLKRYWKYIGNLIKKPLKGKIKMLSCVMLMLNLHICGIPEMPSLLFNFSWNSILSLFLLLQVRLLMGPGTRQLIVVRERQCQFHVIQVKPFKSSEPIMEDSPSLSVTNMGIPTGALIACRIPQLAFFKEGKKNKTSRSRCNLYAYLWLHSSFLTRIFFKL